MVFLVRKIGEKKAGQLLLTADIILASEAKELGLVNYIEEKSAIENAVIEFTKKLIAQNSSQSLSATKAMLAEVQSKPLDDALDFAAKQNALARSTPDCQKGIEAFLGKQNLIW